MVRARSFFEITPVAYSNFTHYSNRSMVFCRQGSTMLKYTAKAEFKL